LSKKMLNILGNSGEEVSKESLKTSEITVSNIEKLNVDGNTIYYIQGSDNNAYKIPFATKYENELAFLKIGDVLNITYIDTEGVKTIKDIKQ
ncbi:MAG: hypothetical protein RR690_01340, partial [Longicatena sp.]